MKTRSFIAATFALIVISACTQENKAPQTAEVISALENKETLENEAWEMEVKYWEYVQNNDTISYKKLWHDDFIGYPSFGEGTSDKSKIAIWIPELHEDTTLTYHHELYKKASNAIEDVVIVFYDAEEYWTDKENNIVRRNSPYKFTHTWKKFGDKWLILGGMAARKEQDVLND